MQKMIYIGPNLPRGRLRTFTVYVGGLPEHICAELSQCPELKKMFVEIKDFNRSMAERNTKGTPLCKYCYKVKEAVKNGL